MSALARAQVPEKKTIRKALDAIVSDGIISDVIEPGDPTVAGKHEGVPMEHTTHNPDQIIKPSEHLAVTCAIASVVQRKCLFLASLAFTLVYFVYMSVSMMRHKNAIAASGEGWTFTDAFWFTFITTSSIGLGDKLPLQSSESALFGAAPKWAPFALHMTDVDILLGMACFAMLIESSWGAFTSAAKGIKKLQGRLAVSMARIVRATSRRFNASTAVTRTLPVTPENDVPVLKAVEDFALLYNINKENPRVSDDIEVCDVDTLTDKALDSATVTISSGLQDEDVLQSRESDIGGAGGSGLQVAVEMQLKMETSADL